ncbi:MAG: 60S ribosomal subunit assembly/export protein [Geoglossum umbratile]|nr:MAG: 60S ribosomal subunit assembly/export protein [Geoglossum umbratile]
MITPVGVEKPRGKKKGKVFVDDQESMMTILAMVNAEKEGMIESKISKAVSLYRLGRGRRMEEIREARLKEAEARQEEKKSKLEETKESIRKKRKRGRGDGVVDDANAEDSGPTSKPPKHSRKRVSFA